MALGPAAVELVDRTLLVLGADIPLFRPTLGASSRGDARRLLLVEFAGDDRGELLRDLGALDE